MNETGSNQPVIPSAENDQWLRRLRDPLEREIAIGELTRILVRGLAKSITARYGHSAAPEDLAQDAILKIIDSLDDFRGESRFTSWALTIAIRLGLSELRRKRYQDVSFEALARDGLTIEPVKPCDSVERNLDRAVIESRLAELIDEKLTPKQQQATRALLEGMPVEVIAEKMGSNRNAIYKLIHDARVKLKEGFEESGFTSDDITAVLTRNH